MQLFIPSLSFLASLFLAYLLIQQCYLDALSFHYALDGLVSLLGRGSELGSHFSSSIVALELHFQYVFDVFLHHLCSLS